MSLLRKTIKVDVGQQDKSLNRSNKPCIHCFKIFCLPKYSGTVKGVMCHYYQISILHPSGQNDLCSQKTETGKGDQQRMKKTRRAALKTMSGGTQPL